MRAPFRAAFFFLIFTSNAYAGAWTEPQGDGLVIVTGSYYSADTMFTNDGQKTSQPAYSKEEINPYMEYGLRDGLTIGANILADRASQNGSSTINLGDSEFFARARLWQGNGFSFSAEPVIKLPSPESKSVTPLVGSEYPDAGLTLSGGYGFKAYGLDHFVDIDAGYRYRFGPPKDQVRLNGTLGVSVSQKWVIMPQIFMTYRTQKTADAAFTESPGDDYNLVTLQLSALYKMTDTTFFQLGAFSHVSGSNTDGGEGVLAGIWKKF